MQKKSFPWLVIIIMFFLFFPVGIYMLVKKMIDEKSNYIKNGKSLRIFGVILIGIGIMYLILGIAGELKTEDGSSVVGGIIMMLLIFGGGGVFALYKAQGYIKKGTKYNRYLSIITSDQSTSIDNIAATYPTTYEQAVEDLQSMINDGFFPKARIDLNQRELIIPGENSFVNAPVNQEFANPPAANLNAQPITVKCKNCGATNTIVPGTANECEYCGSPL